ncbi:MAG: 3-dehydro-L-gulonate 2-dehydrogenase [Acidobacteriaceae bacterium]
MKRVAFAELQGRIELVLLALGIAPARAALGACLIAETDRDGVRTHGVARLPRFAQWVRSGLIDPRAGPEKVAGFGAIERWTGRRGPGNLAAHSAMQRAMELAREHGLGCVALADTSHWMRAGTYGWQAADAGFAAMCWTNTLPNLPPWGASTAALGNNPLVVAIPRRVISRGESESKGEGQSAPIVLDMAMSQFSYGTLASYRLRGEALPVPGGYDEKGRLTTDAATIERTQRALPIGYWKGSGLSFVLDVLAAMLTGGLATNDLTTDPLKEVGQSQVFLAIAPASVETIEELSRFAQGASVAQRAIDALHAATPIEPGHPVRYPGEGTLRAREESMRLGVAVEDAVWDAFVQLEMELSHV